MKPLLKLQTGDSIAIVATARKITEQELQPAIELLESWGLKIVFSPHLFATDHQFAGTDQIRANDLQWAINRPEIKAIMVARGGYGTSRIIDKVDFSPLQQSFKWIIGYSDITVLHQRLAMMEIPSLHATMPISIPNNDNETLKHLKTILFSGKAPSYSFKTHKLNKAGLAEGLLIGGNLSVIYHLRGTRYDLDVSGKILFLEDLDEYLYHIDRMLQNFKLSGWFDSLAGLLIGDMPDMHDNTVPFGRNAQEIVAEQTRDYPFPVAFVSGLGHGSRNLPLILNHRIEMNITTDGCNMKWI